MCSFSLTSFRVFYFGITSSFRRSTSNIQRMGLLNTRHPVKSSVEVEKSVLQLRMPPAARLLAVKNSRSGRLFADPTIGLGIVSLNLNLNLMA